jgi:hypothetical protein
MIVLCLAVLTLMLLASEVGYRIGHLGRVRHGIASSQQQNLQTAMLGLLALLLGFSFAMAQSRFDARKQLVFTEANAIGTAALRTRALPDSIGAALRRTLAGYVDERLALDVRHAPKAEELHATDRLESEAWPRAAELARQDPRSVPAGLMLQALNDVIDLNQTRVEVDANHVPNAVLGLLLVVSMIAMGWVGIGAGRGAHSGMATRVVLALTIALVAAMIADLDQPRLGLIRVGHSAFRRLQKSLACDSAGGCGAAGAPPAPGAPF